jgi:DNA-binding CsgD family transcriptional regulator
LKLLDKAEGGQDATTLMELWFDAVGGPRLILSDTLMVIACNAAAETLLREGDVLTQRGGVLSTANRDCQSLLQALVARHKPPPLVLPSLMDKAPLVIRAEPLDSDGLVALEMRRAEENAEAPLPDLTLVFGLTRGEVALVRPLLRGLSNVEIARELQLSIETVRTHLKNACAKLGVSGRGPFVAKINTFLC